MKNIGVHALVSLLTYLITVGLSFKEVTGLQIDRFFKKGHVFEKQVLLLFLAIALGYLVGQFLIAIIDQSQALLYLF